jgi:integrase
MTVARSDRYGHQDATAIMVAFRHGLRASELCDLQWDQIDFTRKTFRVRRVESDDPSTHYLSNTELRVLLTSDNATLVLWTLFVTGRNYRTERNSPFANPALIRLLRRTMFTE